MGVTVGSDLTPGGLRRSGIVAPCVIDGPINGALFLAWVEQFLLPTLRPGDGAILDSLGSHKEHTVRRAIRAAGAHLLFLPPYNPNWPHRYGRMGHRQTDN